MAAESGPPEGVLRILCRKWAGAILVQLTPRPLRFGELARTHPGLSRRVLAAELRRLRDDGVIRRDELPGRQVKVRYTLTAVGLALRGVMRRLRRWERRHLEEGAGRTSAGASYSKVTS